MPGTVRTPLEPSATATAAEGLRGCAPFSSSCLNSCSRMGSIFCGIVTIPFSLRACASYKCKWQLNPPHYPLLFIMPAASLIKSIMRSEIE